eukprot:TRINITY_DN23774_c0_g1_i1.p1 TRINITY_DN23774_c0_g1~~TRINITY_DN23774_c0_g1_i1.p1  ORF type:complete len:121 (-),score=30.40 TRINITY_DN23774_c0_g1_i1:105-467(-)
MGNKTSKPNKIPDPSPPPLMAAAAAGRALGGDTNVVPARGGEAPAWAGSEDWEPTEDMWMWYCVLAWLWAYEGRDLQLYQVSHAFREICLLYTSDAADEEDSVDLGGRRIIKKKKIDEMQ